MNPTPMAVDLNDWISGRWERREGEEWRYYQAFLEQDLWGHWCLTRVWGGLIRRTGQMLRCPVDSREAGLAALRRIARERRAHRYRLMTSSGELTELWTDTKIPCEENA
jgi:hypothetical protein